MRASPRYLKTEAGEGFRNVHPIQPGLRDSSERPSLGDFLCSEGRRTPLGPLPSMNPLDLKALPPLDAVVISHDHYDHLDHGSIRELVKLQSVPFITSLGVGAHLQAWGVPPERIVELDWWEHWQHPAAELRIHATPSQHFSGRSLTDRNATLWSSLVIETPRHRVFFSGDTGLTSEYAGIRERLGPFDLVMLEVGAFHPSWGDIHLGPENALKALQFLGGGAFLPVHWGTFSLALHDWDQPAETLLELGPRQGAQLLMPRLGEAVEPAHGEPATPWWRAADVPTHKRAKKQAVREEEPGKLPPTMPWPLD